jgi:hypothetical protein
VLAAAAAPELLPQAGDGSEDQSEHKNRSNDPHFCCGQGCAGREHLRFQTEQGL